MPRILIVEDDDHIRTALRLMFEGEGFEVDDAPTGEAASRCSLGWPRTSRSSTSCCPGMTGFETCSPLRSASDLPIVIVSARDDTADVVLGLESGRRRLRHQALRARRTARAREGPPSPATGEEHQRLLSSASCTSFPTRASCAKATAPSCTSRRPSSGC